MDWIAPSILLKQWKAKPAVAVDYAAAMSPMPALFFNNLMKCLNF
jgi:hypothetical protein